VKVTLESEKPSGNPKVDRIPVEFHPASARAGEKSPAVVLLHPLGTKKLREMRQFARQLEQFTAAYDHVHTAWLNEKTSRHSSSAHDHPTDLEEGSPA